ncbi:MAG: type I-E CRISPR-associated endoribonuclease Cas2e [Janthinobacterium lividum]
MTVLILERVPATLRGELSRWMIEPRTGVFVGKVSAMVRDSLWDKARSGAKSGAGMLLYSSPTEQGFLALSFGDTSRDLVDWEGLTLVFTPKAAAKEKRSRKENKEITENTESA